MPAPSSKFRVLINTLQELNGPALRKPALVDYARLLFVSGLWGGSFLLNELALVDFPPVAIAACRVLLAALIVCGVCFAMKLTVALDRRTTLLFLAVGLLNSAVPFSLIGWGQLHIDSATTAILLATSPFATLLLSHYMTRDDRFTREPPLVLWLALGLILTGVALGQRSRRRQT